MLWVDGDIMGREPHYHDALSTRARAEKGRITFTPLIFSGIFYASNGEFHIDYIDCLFNCVSAMTVCGLASVDLSSLTSFQQALLFIQMCLGSPVVVSWTMVFIRR
ncbi:hypothetical protein NUW54_g10849 [Trametes sanguinea]|uniref:Uncharacterized protein n=1 Tax=Trametes sanguinea TaxID=158606 RepID=A0ACC1NRP3_9APHY|nr:hypothetical protein NUW54_g10849 [Trametes sanguinea]